MAAEAAGRHSDVMMGGRADSTEMKGTVRGREALHSALLFFARRVQLPMAAGTETDRQASSSSTTSSSTSSSTPVHRDERVKWRRDAGSLRGVR